MAQLAVLPGLLGRLDPETAAPSVTAPLTLLPRLLTAAATRRRAEQRRRTRQRVAVGLAAAVIAGTVGFGVHLADQATGTPPVVALPTQSTPTPGPPSTEPTLAMTAMRQTSRPVPVDASIALTPAEGGAGTWVSMHCFYEKGYDGLWPVRLIVFPNDGRETEQVGTWLASSGQAVELKTLSHFTPQQIARVELQSEEHNTLLWWTPT
jgi:hypothetical protein